MTLTRSGARLSRAHFDELRSRFEELTRAATDRPDDDGVWTRVLFTLIDLQDRPATPDTVRADTTQEDSS